MKRISQDIFLGIIIFAALLFWGIALTFEYLSFSFFDWDLAFFAQSMYSMLHGSLHSSLFGINFLGNHANFIALFFLPIYALFPNALTLLYIKVFFICLAAFPLYLIGKEIIGKSLALVIVIAYFLYPGLQHSLWYEFHWESISPFFIFLLFYYYRKCDFKKFTFISVPLILIKENLSLLLPCFSVYSLFKKRSKRWFFYPFLMGIIYFLVVNFLVIPFFKGAAHGYLGHYGVLQEVSAGGTVQPLLSFIANPRFQNLHFLFQLFYPLAFLSLLAPQILFLTSPIFLQHFLSSAFQEHSIYFHYTSSLAPFIFIAAIYGIAVLLKRFKNKRVPFFIGTGIIFCSLFSTLLWSPSFSKTLFKKDYFRKSFVKKIPRNAGVLTTFQFMPHLAQRHHLYSFHRFNNSYQIPKDVDYALVDYNDRFWRYFMKQNKVFLEDTFSIFKQEWQIIVADRGIVLYKKNAQN